MMQEILTVALAVVFSNVATWAVTSYRVIGRNATLTAALRTDLDLHRAALARTDSRLRMVLRLTVDIARKNNVEIRAADILEMADVLGGE